MNAYQFKAQPLTPIHVGSGQEIQPMEFVLLRERIIQFNPVQVLNDLPNREMDRYLQLINKADLKGIQSFLRTHFIPERHAIAELDASEAFQSEFEAKIGNPNNQFRVDMMPRNPHSGQVYVPGSSIKGAIRTAVVNYFANLAQNSRDRVHEAVENEVSKKGRILEEVALNRTHSQTERDVFRLVAVEDVTLPRAATRIDRVVNINPNKKGAEKIQIWAERIKARSDDVTQAPGFTVTLRLDTLALNHDLIRPCLGRTLDLNVIINACNRFYWKRMEAEGEKFDGRKSNGAGWKALYDLFPKGKTPDGQIVAIEPSKSYWCTDKRKRMLLRVGRFSHFESLSVDELRQGYNVQARRPISDMGASRTRCIMENGEPPMPFGWLLLTLDT